MIAFVIDHPAQPRPIAERRPAMNALAMMSAHDALLLAHQRSQELIAEADANRDVARARTGRPSRIAAAIASVKAGFRAPEPGQEPSALPRLTDYPYRS
jgi:hypothetical protein